MGIAHLLHVGHQLVRQLAVGVEVAVLVHFPRAEMALVNIHRVGIGQMIPAPFQPACVVPLIPFQIVYLGSVARPGLGMEAVRVGLVKYIAGFGPHAVFICRILRDMGNKHFPDALLVPLHVVHIAVPAVEFAHDRYLFGFRRVHTEQITGFAILLRGMRAHVVIRAAVPAGIKKLASLFAGRRCGSFLHIASLPFSLPKHG